MASKNDSAEKCGGCTWYRTILDHGKSCKSAGVKKSDEPCKHYRNLDADVARMLKALQHTPKKLYGANWLSSMSNSQAFFVCLGAGPWVFERRAKVQDRALKWLKSRSLDQLKPGSVDCFPLGWENKYANQMVAHLHESSATFDDLCADLMSMADSKPQRALFSFYKACGVPKGAKVLSLFARDKLKIASFPIDRHVERHIQRFELPQSEPALIRICRAANRDPRIAARAFVQTGLNGGNPTHVVD